MKKHTLILSLIFSFLLINIKTEAQILVSRNCTIDPFVDSTTTGKVLGLTAFNAEFSRGYGSTSDAHAWNARLNGLFELYRFNSNLSFVFATAHEITADLYNNLYFNPKGAIWHESFSLFSRQKNYTLEFGISHRCRHNIDNADTDDGDTLNIKGITYRILILNAPYINVFSKNIKLTKNLTVMGSLRGEYFWYAYDSRYPLVANNDKQKWSNMQAAFHGSFTANYNLSKFFTAYTKLWGQFMIFNDKTLTNNFRIETGFMLKGEKANMQLFAAYEYFFDDYSRHIPRTSGVVFIGARLGGKVFR